jgi:hypothetical protein
MHSIVVTCSELLQMSKTCCAHKRTAVQCKLIVQCMQAVLCTAHALHVTCALVTCFVLLLLSCFCCNMRCADTMLCCAQTCFLFPLYYLHYYSIWHADAYSVSLLLGACTYPFLALLICKPNEVKVCAATHIY